MSSRRKPPPAAVANPTSTRKVIARTATRTTVPASGEPILPARQRKVVKLRRRTGTAGSTSLPRSSTETRIKSSAEQKWRMLQSKQSQLLRLVELKLKKSHLFQLLPLLERTKKKN